MTAALALRPYQLEAVEAAERDLAIARSTLIEAATGSGKTTTFSELARRTVGRGGRVLILAHRRELVDQAAERVRLFGMSALVLRGKARWSGEAVVCASVAAMRRRLATWPPDFFALVIVDEAHHAPALGYQVVLAHFAGACVLGVTATPARADGVSLGTVFNRVSARYGVRRAIADGWLVSARGLRVVVDGMDLSKVRLKTVARGTRDVRDLHPGDLGAAAIAPAAVEGVAGPLLELAGDRRTVVFAVDRRHARAIADAINARRPDAARVVDGDMPAAERAQNLADHKAGAYQCLINVMVLTEGYDDPAIACVAMARPTTSWVLYAQACGRGLRPSPGKRDLLVLDFVGAACAHNLVGPEDALAGALEAPVTVHRPARKPSPAPAAPAYQPKPSWRARMKATAVKVVRGAARGLLGMLKAWFSGDD